MPDDYDKRTAAPGEDSQPVADEFGAYPLALAIRVNSHRSQAHSDHSTAVAFDYDRREQDVPHDRIAGLVNCDERERFATGLPQLVDKAGFRGLPERQLVDLAYGHDIIRRFTSDQVIFGHATCRR